MVTKGDFTEQTEKPWSRSELKRHFTAVEVLTEKNAAAYRELLVPISTDSLTTRHG